MRSLYRQDSGQALVEFAVIGIVFLALTAGLVDVGRAFYQYNALSGAARFGARWGSVVGGQCQDGNFSALSKSDWCSQFTSDTGSTFWSQFGNYPLQQGKTPCPDAPGDTTRNGCCPSTSNATGDTYYYTASDPRFTGSTATSIVGAIVHRFDSNSSGWNTILGAAIPGINLGQVKVCIQLPSYRYAGTNTWTPFPADSVTVFVYEDFTALDTLVAKTTVPLVASSEYQIEQNTTP